MGEFLTQEERGPPMPKSPPDEVPKTSPAEPSRAENRGGDEEDGTTSWRQGRREWKARMPSIRGCSVQIFVKEARQSTRERE